MNTLTSTRTCLRTTQLTVAYHEHVVLRDVNVANPADKFTVIVGPNACGKSTLLKTLGRVLKPTTGAVWLEQVEISTMQPKAVVRKLSMLPQHPTAPDGMIVEDLVSRGRYPHQGLLQQWSTQDTVAEENAMAQANVTDLRHRDVAELSGGQRQRVWIAMVLAQETPILMLDEPTTYLDIAHQVEVLNLCRKMQRNGTTVVAVLHDLNLAFRYADHLVVMAEGQVQAEGKPNDIVSAQLLHRVFGLACQIIPDPLAGTPMVVPLAE